MPTHKSYHSYLIESLKDPVEAAAYLDAVIEDGEIEYILLALKNVAEAQKSQSDRDLENSDRLVDRNEIPELLRIAKLLNELGLKLSVTVKEEQCVQ